MEKFSGSMREEFIDPENYSVNLRQAKKKKKKMTSVRFELTTSSV